MHSRKKQKKKCIQDYFLKGWLTAVVSCPFHFYSLKIKRCLLVDPPQAVGCQGSQTSHHTQNSSTIQVDWLATLLHVHPRAARRSLIGLTESGLTNGWFFLALRFNLNHFKRHEGIQISSVSQENKSEAEYVLGSFLSG